MTQESLRMAQSRMKYRKVLGLGENMDGHLPKSKISQLLGNNHMNQIVIEKGDYPLGLRCFQWFTCIYFCMIGVLDIVFPQHFYTTAAPNLMDPNNLVRQVAKDLKTWHDELSSDGSNDDNSFLRLKQHFTNLEHSLLMLEVPVRLFGVACLSLSALFFIVSVINTDNRRAIRIALIVEAMYFVLAILVTLCTVNPFNTENFAIFDPTSLFWLTSFKLMGTALCAYYFYQTKPGRHHTHSG